jgi:hypothetical protein
MNAVSGRRLLLFTGKVLGLLLATIVVLDVLLLLLFGL